MRLFVGVWPSDEVRAALALLARPEGAARWTPPEQWHVTLRFLGEVEDAAPWAAQLASVAAGAAARRVVLGPATRMLGRDVLVVPAAGLDDLGAAFGTESFRGHLTLARRAPRALAGGAFRASWDVTEVALIRSHLGGSAPARYETIATAPLG